MLIVIPARYASSRFPAKPLAPLTGVTGLKKTLIQRSWEAAKLVSNVDKVVVATDDDRIRGHVEDFGGEVVMTSSEHRNGTERCAEVADKFPDFKVFVNFQGDAPLTPPWFITALIEGLDLSPDAAMATPVLRTRPETLAKFQDDRRNDRVGGTTVVVDNDSHAIYFSKEVLPHTPIGFGNGGLPVFHHVGAYAYRRDGLKNYMSFEETELEKREGLEQLRFIVNRQLVRCVEVEDRGQEFWELNNPEDVDRIEHILKVQGIE